MRQRTTVALSSYRNGQGSLDDELTKRRRREILLGACEVFDQRGYANTRVSDIAEHLHVGKGTLYRYFESMSDLMDQIVQHAVRRMLGAMQEDAAASASNLDEFTTQIATVAGRLLEIAAEEPVLIRVLFTEAPSASPASLQQLVNGLSAATARYLDQGVKRGFLNADLNSSIVADAMVGVLIPAIARVLRGELDGPARRRHADTVGALIANGTAQRH